MDKGQEEQWHSCPPKWPAPMDIGRYAKGSLGSIVLDSQLWTDPLSERRKEPDG